MDETLPKPSEFNSHAGIIPVDSPQNGQMNSLLP